jgi:hypothetical protein
MNRLVRNAPAAGLLAALVCAVPLAGQDKEKKDPQPGEVEVRLADNSVLKLKLKDQKLAVTTPYGKLLVPVAEIHKIEFATRSSEEDLKRVASAVAKLGSTDFTEREAAGKELLKLGAKAYPALLEAAKSDDAEVKRRAEDLVRQLREAVPEDQLAFRKHDAVHTEHGHFTGQIEAQQLKADTLPFGEVQVKLIDLRSLRSMMAEPEQDSLVAEPDPGALYNYQNHVGKKFAFRVTGAAAGSVWGTDLYTLDSTLAVAAVHAGAVKLGQTGVVKVLILGPQPGFRGSARNGVATSDWGPFPGAYQFVK